MKRKKILGLILALVCLVAVMMAGCESKPLISRENTELMSGKHHAEINIENYGTISLELDADEAPLTVTNFVNLANEGFYDGTKIHRVVEDFIIQGGDPTGTGGGGSGSDLEGEFSSNGIENNLSHTRGAISMARSQSYYNGASSQFFIVDKDSTDLDGDYACFGYVTDGMDIVDEICNNTPVQDNNGTVAMKDRAVVESIKIID